MRIARCIKCGKALKPEVRDDKKVWVDPVTLTVCEKSAKAQIGYGYICKECAEHYKDCSTYDEKNEEHTGTAKSVGWTHGTELECNHFDEDVNSFLHSVQFIGTHDCTVACEFKSPIQHGLGSLSKVLTTLDKYADMGKFSTEDYVNGHGTCGTHQNIGMAGEYGWEEAHIVREHYHALFMPLSKALKNNPEKTAYIFGRELTGFAHAINEHSEWWEHENFINVTKDVCIEFRLCKYHAGGNGGKKYIETIKFCRKIFKATLDAVKKIQKTNDDVIADEIARKAGLKIAKLFDKVEF